MVAGLLLLILVAVLVTLAVRTSNARHGGGGPSDGHAVRRFFQYLLLYGLLVVVGIGLSGLLGRLLEWNVLVAGDEAALARDLAFTVVGVPVFAGVALWSRRRFAADAGEARSLGWAFYVTAASLTSLVLSMTGLGQVLRWATGLSEYSGSGLARFLVWGAVWGAHWWLDARVTPSEHSRVHHLAGSLIGLATAATGLAGVLAGALGSLLGLEEGAVLADNADPILRGAVVLAVGAPVWFVYWIRTAASHERDPLWFGYVLLAGIGGGLVTAITSASTLLYSVLVWLVGDPRSADAAAHFENAPTAAAATAVGVLVWWYHQAVLKGAGAETRTEVRRIYEYLMAGIGLIAAAAGLTTAVVALIEALAGTERVIFGGSIANTLIAAATLLAVGGPVWWIYWRRIQAVAKSDPAAELASPTRRVYLFVLFGLGGVAAVVALLVGVYLFFQDLVDGTVGAETLRRMRFSIGVLLTTAAIAAYHWAVYRSDRAHAPTTVKAHGPRYVLLVGPADPEIAREVAHRTRGRVQAWSRTDDGLARWSVDEVMAALDQTTSDEVIVLSEAGGLHAIPVHRS